MFSREHHQRIAQVLSLMNASLLREQHCLFGGGTAIALRFGEYRESVDIDFMVSDSKSYGQLRGLLTGLNGIAPLLQPQQRLVSQQREIRADQYGIRTVVAVAGYPIKFEIILEGRIEFDAPSSADQVCGVPTLTLRDMACTKLLANSDRWADDGVFNRDLIDLVMMEISAEPLQQAMEKAKGAYGESVAVDLGKAIDRLLTRQGWMERCMQALSINIPKAVIWDKVKNLQSRLN